MRTALPDSVRIVALNTLAEDGYLYSRPDSADALATISAGMAHEKGFVKLEVKALTIQGIAHQLMGELDTAMARFNATLELRRAIHDSAGISASLHNIGIIHTERGEPEKAIDLLEQSLMIDRSRSDIEGMGSSFAELGMVYQDMGATSTAIDYYGQSLRIAERLKDTISIAMRFENLGTVYQEDGDTDHARVYYDSALIFARRAGHTRLEAGLIGNLGTIFKESKDFSGAAAQFEQSLEMMRRIGDQHGVASAMGNLGVLYYEQGRNAEALERLEQCIGLQERIGDRTGSVKTFLNLAKAYERSGDLIKAVRYGERAVGLAREIRSLPLLKDAAQELSSFYKSQGRIEPALEMIEVHLAARDSFRSHENRRSVLRFEYEHRYAKRALTDSLNHANQLTLLENRRLLAERKSDRAMIIGGSAVLLLLAGMVLYRLDRRRRQARYEKDAAQLETQALRSQMNPHFIFNALNSISAYVQKNEPDKAVGYLGKFARLMRLVLENSRQAEVPLKDDLEALDAYLHLERTRGGEKFDYSITVDPAIDQEDTLVPPLVIQPFVENAIWHGMAGKEGKGHITLSVSRRADELIMAIEDDGVGRHAPKKVVEGEPVKKTSLATTITQARLDLVQKQKGRPAGFKYIDLPQGTRVEVSLPISEAA